MAAPGDKTVAVVGGGLAGLATAVRLADAGYRPTVIESRKMLGGRATSLVDPRTDRLIDNCQQSSGTGRSTGREAAARSPS
jgi:uncharacterized protein with NAD-binding domain and iron-sulfur cluster